MLHLCGGALMIWVCRHPYTWDNRAWPLPPPAHLRDQLEAWAGFRSTPGDNDQSLQPGTSLSSVQCLCLSECISHELVHTASLLPVQSGLTGLDCPPVRRLAPGPRSCLELACSEEPAHSVQLSCPC